MSLRIKIILLLFFYFPVSFTQMFERSLNKIPVIDASGIIPNTFSGGHNNIEHQFVDIDGDGDFDIMYLDSDKTYGWYENVGNRFNPTYVLSFDTIPGMKFSDWFYFADIDNDGDQDFFTGGAPALIEFRLNDGNAANPFFVLALDTLKDDANNPIFSEFGSNPVLVDIDKDGDLDLFSGTSLGTISFFENIGTNNSFIFKFISESWEGICLQCNPDNNRHGASSIDFVDIDNDNDYDLFVGDFFSKSMYFIQNNGTATVPSMDAPFTFSTFPRNEDSIWTSGFNMPRFVDIDNDGDFDLFISVLFYSVETSLMFYRNEGTANNANFNRVTEYFLKTLDVGSKSSPVFVDIDSDGDLDLFIGSERISNGTLHFFENTGTQANPSFLLIDSVYSGIEGDLYIAPSFGDLDGDGDNDLLTGEFLGRISLYENTGTKFSPNFQFAEQLKDSSGNFISVGNYARPFLIDVDGDGDLDLVTGGFNGQVRLYRNVGTANNYLFVRDTEFFGPLDAGDHSSPFLIDFDGDGDLDLFVGADNVSTENLGNIFYYRNDGNNFNPVWTLVTNKFLNQTFGGYTAPFFIDIDNDTDIDLFIGNIKGGIYHFENKLFTSVKYEEQQPVNFSIEAFPNPFNSQVNILVNLEKTEKVTISIYNILGESVIELFSDILYRGSNQLMWNGQNEKKINLPSGNYFVVVKTFDNLKTFKLILLK